MISPDIFQPTDIKISEKWNCSSAIYTPENLKTQQRTFFHV